MATRMIWPRKGPGPQLAPRRTKAGCRLHTAPDVHTLRFIRPARDLGGWFHGIGERVGLWRDRLRPSRRVEALAQARDRLATKASLQHLVQGCHGDERPDCPILDNLADVAPASPARHAFCKDTACSPALR